MVRERGRGPSGRHDGQEYWTLPGGGIIPGETTEDAVGERSVKKSVYKPFLSGTCLMCPTPRG